jgi:hypothetical protein
MITTATRPAPISIDDPCPNCEYSHLRDVAEKPVWNPHVGYDWTTCMCRWLTSSTVNHRVLVFIVSHLIFPFLPFPMVNQRHLNILTRQVNELACKYHDLHDYGQAIIHNEAQDYIRYPLKAAELSSFMWAAVDAETCLRRKWCDPVGGYSVYSSPTPNSDFEGKETVILATATNARSFFHDSGALVESSLSGLVGVLAVADALSHVGSCIDMTLHCGTNIVHVVETKSI